MSDQDKATVLKFKLPTKSPARAPSSEAQMYDLGPHDRMTPAEALSVVLREDPKNVVIMYTKPGVDPETGEDIEITVVRHSANLSNADLNFIADKLKLRSLGFEV